jgi:hypothetical protein
MLIKPHDVKKDIMAFDAPRLRGSHQIGTTGILIRRYGKPWENIFLKTTKIRDILMEKIRTFIG